MLKPYNELVKIDVTPYCQYRQMKNESGKMINIPYLNWAMCKELLHQHGAEKVYYEPLYNNGGHSLFLSPEKFIDKYGNANQCYEVKVKTVIDDNEYTINYPVLSGVIPMTDKTINQIRVASAQARAFVKCVAIHTGLGFNLWVKGGDDIELAESEDLSMHNIFAIKRRVEQNITACMQKGKDLKDIIAALDLNEKQFKQFLSTFDRIHELEGILRTL